MSSAVARCFIHVSRNVFYFMVKLNLLRLLRKLRRLYMLTDKSENTITYMQSYAAISYIKAR